MEIVPVINCDDFECVKNKINLLYQFNLSSPIKIHIDISDGDYAKTPKWNDPLSLQYFLEEKKEPFLLSVHFMMRRPLEHILKWQNIINRAVIPLDADEDLNFIIESNIGKNIIFCLSIPPNKNIEDAVKYAHLFNEFQILGVSPGPSGQSMTEGTIAKIKKLKNIIPSAIIEIDGGVNPDTLPELKESGVDIALSGSYIFNADDPKSAYLKLKEL